MNFAQDRLSPDWLSFAVTLASKHSIAWSSVRPLLLGNALLCFDEYPEAWQQLLQNRSLVPSAIEEVLRYMSPNKSLGESVATLKDRTATVDVTLGG